MYGYLRLYNKAFKYPDILQQVYAKRLKPHRQMYLNVLGSLNKEHEMRSFNIKAQSLCSKIVQRFGWFVTCHVF